VLFRYGLLSRARISSKVTTAEALLTLLLLLLMSAPLGLLICSSCRLRLRLPTNAAAALGLRALVWPVAAASASCSRMGVHFLQVMGQNSRNKDMQTGESQLFETVCTANCSRMGVHFLQDTDHSSKGTDAIMHSVQIGEISSHVGTVPAASCSRMGVHLLQGGSESSNHGA
jgi:hypothetical protein